ncbi:hypothetical protein EW093_11515 [Thiospirochaeta perfilievii]|uniref:Pyruvate phosphate dikinase AMP/ATP-binding domain-containing protein n=1 Tax=Thiospirochaeta perfilievii TaxID=252967 RepID=A0A5C1QF88_9SPIO|nr:PEP/pyruvate-binding domain-containing protein [Thiospirochaeta perfilievii]QEN05314.1 hypothetical protein EW093_11515 [Thiospirochaeta perfilievii]
MLTDIFTKKESLNCLNTVVALTTTERQMEIVLQEIVDQLPKLLSRVDIVSSILTTPSSKYKSIGFIKTQYSDKLILNLSQGKKGSLKLYYKEELSKEAKEYKKLLTILTTIITGYISKMELNNLYYDHNERVKELNSIHLTNMILKKNPTLTDSLQEICDLLPEAWQYPKFTVARIYFDNKIFTSRKFKETSWSLKKSFETPDKKKGTLEIFYLKDFPISDFGPFLKEEKSLLDVLASIISGAYTNNSLQTLLEVNTERLKELRGLNKTSEILKNSASIEESLQEICNILPEAWKHPEDTVVRINFNKMIFTSVNFRESIWVQRQSFESPGSQKGEIEVFLLKEYPTEDEGPFLKEERDLLINLSHLISGTAGSNILKKLISENNERLKELRAINRTSKIISECKPVDETMSKIISILQVSWQYPEYTAVKIHYEGRDYITPGYKETTWSQDENFITIDNNKGYIRVVYLKEFPQAYEGPFLKEERDLLVNIGKLITSYFNDNKGRDIFRSNIHEKREVEKPEEYKKTLTTNKKPLQQYFNQQVIDKYIYLDMMKYKVKEILFVSTFYDAFILENEDGFFERFMGEIYQYSLFSLPRITGVTTSEEALEMLDSKSFDLVILMAGLDREAPVLLSEKIKNKRPSLPIYLLINQKSNIKHFEDKVASTNSLDNLFFWNGDSEILFSIVKSKEDMTNVENDTKVGLVRVILMVEDSCLYYSKYLPMLYGIVFGQVQRLLPEVEKKELDKICKMRSRPKILLAKNYEDAMQLFNKYRDYLLCVISDIEFDHGGQLDKNAGIDFIKHVKSHKMKLPIILQSSNGKNKQQADDLDVFFINKNSDTLLNDLKKYLNAYLGFGNFIFQDLNGKKIAEARTLKEFEKQLRVVPDETFYLHATQNQYSIWLMARGEITLAKTINPMRIESLDNISLTREYLLNIIGDYQAEKKKGKVFRFEEDTKFTEKNIVTIAGGSLGGKGRGLAFINTLIYNSDFSTISSEINIRTPKTAIIGTKEFDTFISRNKLYDKVISKGRSFHDIKLAFLAGKLSSGLEHKLFKFIGQIKNPIAVRSSSLSEDSFTQPFAGVYHTYILPNNRENKTLTLEKLKESIKLVFASVFSDEAQGYYKAIHHRMEDEKMAVILQELVGNKYDDYYYPHISGTACSYNYYPVAHMKPEEGFAMTALGLGSYVVEGMNSYRFSPKYPNVDMYSNKDLINSSQVKFYALDCRRENMDYAVDGELASLTLLNISEAEKHGSLKHCASVYDQQNDRVVPGLSTPGPRILNFANILKYNYIPLAKTLEILLNTLKESLGSPVEIEFAVDLNKAENGVPTFYLLQTKPMVDSSNFIHFDIDQFKKSESLLYTQTSLGNGEIDNICDVIYVDKDLFDKMKTLEMVEEIEYLNRVMMNEKRPYILIGPGRWGTRDQFLGIPVNWAQISYAKIIVEISLDNFPLDSSLGSHFFHNVTSMNIGYFSVNNQKNAEFINWDRLYKEEVIHKTNFFRHIRFSKPLKVIMDGRSKKSIIIEDV